MVLFQRFELAEGGLAIEHTDVLRLNGREATHGPAQVDEVWFNGGVERVHANFIGQTVGFAGVAAAAGGDDVGPDVLPSARHGNEVVAGE